MMQHPATTQGHGHESIWETVVHLAVPVVAAALVIATGAIHLYRYSTGYSAVPTIGRLFVANFISAVVLGIIILVRPRVVWCVAGAAFCAVTLAAFLVSVHWGLFGFNETWSGAWQQRAAVVEILGAIFSVWAALLGRSRDWL